MVQADAALVEQALANLVNNASAHTPEGTRVVIDAKLCADRVVLRVTDDGPGIASDIMPRLFEKFVRSGKGEWRQVLASPLPRALSKRMGA